jgi:hypothetical protein
MRRWPACSDTQAGVTVAQQGDRGHAAYEGRMGQWPLGRYYLQWLASRDGDRGRRLFAAIFDLGPRPISRRWSARHS